MFRVMIVEDELVACVGLRNMIDWSEMDMQVVCEARNGKEALELYHRDKPNLVLTDIKMPVMDGLALISEIRKQDQQTKIIVLSCYNDFDMVRQAFQMNVSDYISKLKMTRDELHTVVSKVHKELKAETEKNQLYPPETPVDSSLSAQHFLALLRGDKGALTLQTGRPHPLSSYLSTDTQVLCLMRVELYEQLVLKYQKDKELPSNTICSLIDDMLRKYNYGNVFHDSGNLFVIILNFADTYTESSIRELTNEIAERITYLIKTYFGSPVTIGVSSCGTDAPQLPQMYQEAHTALNEGLYFDGEKICRYGDAANKEPFHRALDGLREQIENTTELGDWSKKDILAEISILEDMYGSPLAEIQELFVRWVHFPVSGLYRGREDLSEIAIRCAGKIRDCHTLAEIIDEFAHYFEALASARFSTSTKSREIHEAVHYIREKYSESISLQEVANAVEMSTGYLSSQFRKEMQIGLIDYLNAVRIEKACELLTTTHLKSYEIAHQVGFLDESYFCRVFKKHTGKRPYEYKKIKLTAAPVSLPLRPGMGN